MIASKNAIGLQNLDIRADVYIGSPISGAVCASNLGKKYGKPSYALIFDPFPMMERYLGKRQYIGWRRLIPTLKMNKTKIIALCETTKSYIMPWLNKTDDEVIVVRPCINSRHFESIKPSFNKNNYIVFISRLVKHKRFEDVLWAIKKNNIKLKVISSVNSIKAQQMAQAFGVNHLVDFHVNCSDEEKWQLIAGSKAVINGSIFEGFGMFVAEAITCGVPFVGYQYPTFQEIQRVAQVNNIYLARFKSRIDLNNKLRIALQENKQLPINKAFYFEQTIRDMEFI